MFIEYFCKITGCFGIKTLLHVTRQCKLRFLDINMHIIEQNIHVLCNMMSYDEDQRLVINFIYISAFCDSYLWLEKLLFFLLGYALTIICCAFAVKPF